MRVIVKEGYSVRRNRKTHGPGKVLQVSEAEARRLIEKGVVEPAETKSRHRRDSAEGGAGDEG
jgi:hypothetical protein